MRIGAAFRAFGRFLLLPLTIATVVALLFVVLLLFAAPLLVLGGSQPFGSNEAILAGLLAVVLLWGIAAAIIQSRRTSEDDGPLAESMRRREEEAAAASTAESAAADAETATIRRKLDRAVARLRNGAPREFLRPRIYRLPWYLVMGPQGAGKTSLIAHSGLDLPFGVDAEGTDGCHFVLTNDAVFVDTEGRLATGPERSVPHQVWLGLLGLIRRYRPAHPLAGIFVVVGATDFASASEEDVRSLAALLRRRLDEMPSRLRSAPPIYLVVTKLDRLVGFEAFFDTMQREEREQIFGVPLTEAGEAEAAIDPGGRFRAGYAELVRRMAGRQIHRLQEEPDERRRNLVYEFPNQLAGLGEPLATLVGILSAPHRFDRPPFLRGVFLTSTIQSERAVDVIASAMARSPAHARNVLAVRREDEVPQRSRAFFVKSMLRELAFLEAAAGSARRGAWYASNRWRALATGLAALLALGVLSFWSTTYREGAAHAQAVETTTETLSGQLATLQLPPPALVPFSAVMAIMDRFADLHFLGQQTSGSGLLSTEPVAEATALPYGRAIDQFLAPYLTLRVENGLRQPDASSAATFAQLKLYLLLTREREPAGVRIDGLAQALVLAWLGEEASAAQVASLDRHLRMLAITPYSAAPPDAELVADARARLAEATIARLAYDLVAARPAIQALPAWRPSDRMSAAGPLVMARASGTSIYDGLPGLFTRAPFLEIVVPTFDEVAAELAEDAWVLGPVEASLDPADQRARFRNGGLDILRADMVRAWDSFLSDLSVVEPVDAGRAAQLLARLIEPQSPAAQLMAAVGEETFLDIPAEEGGAAVPPGAARLAQAQAGRVVPAAGRSLVPGATRALSGALAGDVADPRGPGAPVTDHFAAVREATVAAAPDQPSQVMSVLRSFEPLYRQLNNVAGGGAVTELGTTLQPTLLAIEEATGQLPPPLQPFFVRLREAVAGVANNRSGAGLREIWATTVLPACRSATQNRFPFTPGSAEDTPLGDFASLFAPEGLIAGFRQTYLEPYLDTTTRPWRWRATSARDLGFTEDDLRALEHADAITRAFFATGEGPATQFALEVAALSNNARSMRFDVGGASASFAHGPASPLFTQWPPAPPGQPAVLTVLPEVVGEPNMIAGQGPWALFRVVGRAQSVRQVDGNSVQASFALGSRRAVVNFTPATSRNPFELGLLDTFRCPAFS